MQVVSNDEKLQYQQLKNDIQIALFSTKFKVENLEVIHENKITIFTFDTKKSNFDVIFNDLSSSIGLTEWRYVPSNNGEIEDFDTEFRQSLKIFSVSEVEEILGGSDD